MSCADCLTVAEDCVCSLMVLIAATLYRIVMFMIFLSASIGPSVLVSRVYNNISGLNPMPDIIEAGICMILITWWAEFSVGFEKRICGDVLEDYKNRYPNTMSFGRFAVHFVLFMTAYFQLYIQFEASNTIPKSGPKKNIDDHMSERHSVNLRALLIDDGREAEVVQNQELHTALFLLSMAYLVFVMTRTFHKGLLNVVGSLPLASFSILSNCMLRIGFAILHVIVDFFYFLPCLAIAYTSRGYKTPGNTTYFQLTFTAGLAGMVGALFELNRPWPQRRGRIPCLFYENNMIGKSMLVNVLVIFTLMGYYRPLHSPKVPVNKFDSTNWDVISFCLTVGYTVLHAVKISAHAVLAQAQDLEVPGMNQGMMDLDIPIVFSENDVPPPPRSGHSGEGGGSICARCMATALNNNSIEPSPTSEQTNDQTNSNNNEVNQNVSKVSFGKNKEKEGKDEETPTEENKNLMNEEVKMEKMLIVGEDLTISNTQQSVPENKEFEKTGDVQNVILP